jgi:hypothetical protein
MYLLTWNSNLRILEATFGGTLPLAEARYFTEDWNEELARHKGSEFTVLLDYATLTHLDEEVKFLLETWREAALAAGAVKVRFLARDDAEAQSMASARVAQVSTGREEYTAFGLAT